MKIGGCTRALHDDPWCGDAWAYREIDGITLVCLVDGLGHGREARIAADVGLATFAQAREPIAASILRDMDVALRVTRGVAAAIATIDRSARSASVTILGNIRVALFSDGALRFEAVPGIVGAGIRTLKTDSVSWDDRDLLVMWTDGIHAELNLDNRFRRMKSEPEALARLLLEQYATGHDDTAVICALLDGWPQ